MQLRAERTFLSRYGMIRMGQNFSAEPGYGQQLVAGGKAKPVPTPLQPDRNQAFKRAPLTKEKKELPTEPPASESPNTAVPQDDGSARPSLLSRAGRALRKKTPTTAAPVARR